MKVAEGYTERHAKVYLYRQGSVDPLDEYGQYVDPVDKALCCFVPVDAKEMIRVGGRFRGVALAVTYDILVDGVYRRTWEWKGKAGLAATNQSKALGTDRYLFQHNGSILESGVSAIPIPSTVIPEAGSKANVGTIEMRVSVLRRPGDSHMIEGARFYYDCEGEGHGTNVTAGFKDVEPDLALAFDHDCPPLLERVCNRYKKLMTGPRPGSEPWAIFRFHYRTLDAIRDKGKRLTFSHGMHKYAQPGFHMLEIEEITLKEQLSPVKRGGGDDRQSSFGATLSVKEASGKTAPRNFLPESSNTSTPPPPSTGVRMSTTSSPYELSPTPTVRDLVATAKGSQPPTVSGEVSGEVPGEVPGTQVREISKTKKDTPLTINKAPSDIVNTVDAENISKFQKPGAFTKVGTVKPAPIGQDVGAPPQMDINPPVEMDIDPPVQKSKDLVTPAQKDGVAPVEMDVDTPVQKLGTPTPAPAVKTGSLLRLDVLNIIGRDIVPASLFSYENMRLLAQVEAEAGPEADKKAVVKAWLNRLKDLAMKSAAGKVQSDISTPPPMHKDAGAHAENNATTPTQMDVDTEVVVESQLDKMFPRGFSGEKRDDTLQKEVVASVDKDAGAMAMDIDIAPPAQKSGLAPAPNNAGTPAQKFVAPTAQMVTDAVAAQKAPVTPEIKTQAIAPATQVNKPGIATPNAAPNAPVGVRMPQPQCQPQPPRMPPRMPLATPNAAPNAPVGVNSGPPRIPQPQCQPQPPRMPPRMPQWQPQATPAKRPEGFDQAVDPKRLKITEGFSPADVPQASTGPQTSTGPQSSTGPQASTGPQQARRPMPALTMAEQNALRMSQQHHARYIAQQRAIAQQQRVVPQEQRAMPHQPAMQPQRAPGSQPAMRPPNAAPNAAPNAGVPNGNSHNNSQGFNNGFINIEGSPIYSLEHGNFQKRLRLATLRNDRERTVAQRLANETTLREQALREESAKLDQSIEHELAENALEAAKLRISESRLQRSGEVVAGLNGNGGQTNVQGSPQAAHMGAPHGAGGNGGVNGNGGQPNVQESQEPAYVRENRRLEEECANLQATVAEQRQRLIQLGQELQQVYVAWNAIQQGNGQQ